MKKVRVGIIGGAGYTGGELLRLLAGHRGVSIDYVTSETLAGKTVTTEYPNLRSLKKLRFQSYHSQDAAGACDFVFLAKPHPNSFSMVRDLFGQVKMIDLSADFRFQAAKDFEAAYGTRHLAPELLKESVYGLPEILSEEIKPATLVANPGCYPTGIILGLFPLLMEGMIEPEVSVSAISGFSGAGRTISPAGMAYALVDNLRPYKVGTHPHAAEIEEIFGLSICKDLQVNFVPQVAGFERGILSVCFLRLKKETGQKELDGLYRKAYEGYPFVRVCPAGQYPELRRVVMTNFCELAVQALKGKTLTVVTALDNLVKGAAGQAIQNLNLMAGFPEEEGLW